MNTPAQRPCPTASKLISPCSGASDVAGLSNRAGRQMTLDLAGQMYCLADMGGRGGGIVANTRAAAKVLVIDGCNEQCARKTLKLAGFSGFPQLQLERDPRLSERRNAYHSRPHSPDRRSGGGVAGQLNLRVLRAFSWVSGCRAGGKRAFKNEGIGVRWSQSAVAGFHWPHRCGPDSAPPSGGFGQKRVGCAGHSQARCTSAVARRNQALALAAEVAADYCTLRAVAANNSALAASIETSRRSRALTRARCWTGPAGCGRLVPRCRFPGLKEPLGSPPPWRGSNPWAAAGRDSNRTRPLDGTGLAKHADTV